LPAAKENPEESHEQKKKSRASADERRKQLMRLVEAEASLAEGRRRVTVSVRLGLTLALMGTAIGLGGLAYASYWIWTHLGA
jgi:hypothetical protein